MRGEGSAAGKEGLVGVPKFHPLGKCTMKPTNSHSDWTSNTFSALACIKPHYTNPFSFFTTWGLISGGGTGGATEALALLIVMFRGLSPPPKCTVCAP